jgi:hypothetical protein
MRLIQLAPLSYATRCSRRACQEKRQRKGGGFIFFCVDNLLELLVLLVKSSVSQESESNIEGKVGHGAIDKNKSVPFFAFLAQG